VRRGRNEFKVDATDPDTGKHAEDPVMIVITVPFREIEAPTFSVDQPADGTTFENGAIPVSGTASNAKEITITAAYDGPVAGAPAPGPKSSGAPARPAAPAAITVPVGDDGKWDTGDNPLQLTTGRWSITTTASSDQGKSASRTIHVAVAYKGVNLVVRIKGGRAWIKVWVDGKVDKKVGSAGTVYNNGKTLTFRGRKSVEVRTGSSGVTLFTLNGTKVGALGKSGIPETWLFEPPDEPQKTNRH